MAEVITFLSSTLITGVLIGYFVVLWLALTVWTTMDIFSRSKNWFVRFGAVLLVGLGFVFGFVLYLIVRPQTTVEESKIRDLEERILEAQSRGFVCPNCMEIVRDDFLFCPSCGINIRRECPSCKRALEIVWAQCPYCGVSVGSPVLTAVKEAPQLLSEKSHGSFFGVFRKIFTTPPTEPTEIKRGRGRPRKPEPLEPVIKRPRGRPKKNTHI